MVRGLMCQEASERADEARGDGGIRAAEVPLASELPRLCFHLRSRGAAKLSRCGAVSIFSVIA